MTTRDVLISKEIGSKSYKEICREEKKKVNVGFNQDWYFLMNNSSMVQIPRKPENYIDDKYSSMIYDWENLGKFFSLHNIEPNWINCYWSWGWYNAELGEWTGCTGKV